MSLIRLPNILARDQSATSQQLIARMTSVFKNRGSVAALRGLDFSLHKGEILCLLGPNGAGKSTCIDHLLGLLAPDRGEVRIFNESPSNLSVRRRIGITPQDTGFPDHLTVEETLNLIAHHYSHPAGISETLGKFSLIEVRKRKTSALSGGQKRCLSLACALIGNPELVILDEPTTGLDVEVRRRLWTNIREFTQNGGTVLFTTHYLDEADELATRVLVVNQGQVIAQGTPAEIKSELALKQIEFHSDDEVVIPIDARVHRSGSLYKVWTPQPDLFVRQLAQQHIYKNLEIRSMRLEEAFVVLIERASQSERVLT